MTVTQLKHPKRLLWVYDNLYLYITFVSLLSFHSVLGELCKFDVDQPCICRTQNFEINLKSFMDTRQGSDLQASGEGNQFNYYVQPCNKKLTSLNPLCINVSSDLVSCQIDKKNKVAYGLGSLNHYDAIQDKENFILKNSFIQTVLPSLNITRILELTIRCSDVAEYFTYENSSGTTSPITYRFTLATSYVCSGEKSRQGLSPGSIVVIIFFVLLIVYIVAGLLYQKFVRKAQGVEIIPNYIFWKDFPFLVKDGFVFTFQCCKGSSGYDQI